MAPDQLAAQVVEPLSVTLRAPRAQHLEKWAGQLVFQGMRHRMAPDQLAVQVVEPKVNAWLYSWGEGRHTAEGEHIPVRIEALEIGYIDGMMCAPALTISLLEIARF